MPVDFDSYLSPFSWRYASPAMRALWSERGKRLLWRRIWLALAKVQSGYGLVSAEQLADLAAHAAEVNIPRALEIEAEIHHDLMAELRTFAEQCLLGGGALHVGATSMDIEDNADVLRLRKALDLTVHTLNELLQTFARQIETWAAVPCIAFTHLQPAEPTTLGYRLANYAQELLYDWRELINLGGSIRGKGFKGAVGTSAAYAELVGADQLDAFEAALSSKLDLPFFSITNQTYPRRQDYSILCALAGMAATLSRFAFDLRVLQSPPIGEWSEPFSKKQVGSSAMPFKRNPINAEKIDSLARSLSAMPQIAWSNASLSLLERTLDDSANRRSLLPEAFLISDEILRTALRLLNGLQIDEKALHRNLDAYGPFAATERVLMALSQAGADRQEAHERLREIAMHAWQAIQSGQPNPLCDLLCADQFFNSRLSPDQIRALFDVNVYTGAATPRALALARQIREQVPIA